MQDPILVRGYLNTEHCVSGNFNFTSQRASLAPSTLAAERYGCERHYEMII